MEDISVKNNTNEKIDEIIVLICLFLLAENISLAIIEPAIAENIALDIIELAIRSIQIVSMWVSATKFEVRVELNLFRTKVLLAKILEG